MSNAYGAGSPQAGLNAPGGMPSWLSDLWNYVNPMAQATAGGVDAQGRPQTPIAGAQQALAAQALNGGPQQPPPAITGHQSATPLPPAGFVDSLTARPATPAMMASMVARGLGGYGTADYPQSAGGYAPRPPMPTAWPASSTPTGMPAPPAVAPPSGVGQGPFAGRPAAVNPHARQQAQVAAAAPQVPWIDSTFERANLPAGNGPLGRNAQRQMGVIDFSKLFNRSS